MGNMNRSEAGRKGAKTTNAKRRFRGIESQQDDKVGFLHTTRPVASLRSGRNDWYEIRDATGDSTDVFIYDEIGFFGVNASDFVTELKNVKTSSINLFINSPGGSVFDGLAIYNSLVRHTAQVNVTIDGIAASAASFIAMAGDTVNIARNGIMMIHDAIGICIGNQAEMDEMSEILSMHSDNIADIYAQKTGVDKDDIRQLMRDETWFNSDEAVEAGLADQIVNSRGQEEEDPEDSFDLSIFSYAGRSKAPAPEVPDNKSGADPNPDPNQDPGDGGASNEDPEDDDLDSLAAKIDANELIGVFG